MILLKLSFPTIYQNFQSNRQSSHLRLAQAERYSCIRFPLTGDYHDSMQNEFEPKNDFVPNSQRLGKMAFALHWIMPYVEVYSRVSFV
jgi:hypothetical protein